MGKNVLVIGSGGRENCICWKLAQSTSVARIFAAPGSFGIQNINPKIENIPDLNIKHFPSIVDYCHKQDIHLVVIGPEDPLANGVADVLKNAKIPCFGPEKKGAQIEADKSWAKAFMDKHGIPSAKWSSFSDANKAKNYIENADHKALVVKASGLAAGKGVVVAKDIKEACDAVDSILGDKKFGSAGEIVVVEELLEGEEVSVLAFTDGKTIRPMLPAQDHKRIFDQDKGPNTGGMGAYCPCPLLSEDELEFVQQNILDKAIVGLQKEGIAYVGVLYAGLMLTKDGVKVLEFNCRFGDPETQVVLPLLESDLFEIMTACCTGSLDKQQILWVQNESAVGVVMASRGYPETSSKGQIISGVEDVSKLEGHIVFHSGTAMTSNDELVTNGGRVLIVVAKAPHLTIAAAKATHSCELIKFDGAQYRHDIAHKGVTRQLIQSGTLTYKASGVDIVAGDSLVSHIKPLAKSTNRVGLLGAIGGFGGLFDTNAAGFKDPILVSGTDGVGTKLKIAQSCGLHTSIGIDLVAMCVNDILAHGAEPLFFLDYFACGVLDVNVAKDVVSGIAEGCLQAGCALIGGETAEMPSMYAKGDYDLAGFAVGAVERNQMIPQTSEIRDGDIVIGVPSSGVHSNGFSLVRRVMELAGVSYSDKAPFSATGKTFGEELLIPTKIYVKALIPPIKKGLVKAFAHITGGGLTENIPRVLTKNLKVELNSETWNIPPVFGWLAALGEVNEYEMLRTFNCGVGGVIIVSLEHANQVLDAITDVTATVIGKVYNRVGDEPQVIVHNFQHCISNKMLPHIPLLVRNKGTPKKKVAVLISGSGTNLQTLIDATQDPTKHMGAEIVLVISNKSNVEGLKRAERAQIPTVVVKHTDFKNREDFDDAMDSYLVKAGVEIICLAGFMRIMSSKFVNKWHGRLINIHPSLLPMFKGTHAQRQALEAGVKVSGCTVHFVEADIDSGAILTQEVVPVYAKDTEEDLIERIKQVAEQKAYPAALKLLATNRVTLDLNKKLKYL